MVLVSFTDGKREHFNDADEWEIGEQFVFIKQAGKVVAATSLRDTQFVKLVGAPKATE